VLIDLAATRPDRRGCCGNAIPPLLVESYFCHHARGGLDGPPAQAGHRRCGRSGSGWVGDPLLRTPPRRAWFDDYYDVRGPRATQLRTQPDTAVRELAEDTLTEIDIFRRCDGDYGYVFFALRRV
jgi:hypothetical protein